MIIKCPKCNKVFDSTKAMGKKEVCEHCEAVFLIDDSVVYDPKSDQNVAKDREVGKTPAKRKKTALIVFVCGVLLAVVVGGGYFIARNRRLLNSSRQKTVDSLANIQQEQVLKEKIEAGVEKRIAEERAQQLEKESDKAADAYKKIVVEDVNYHVLIGGGQRFTSVKLYNPTPYYFVRISYELIDTHDNVVRYANEVGPLGPYEREKYEVGVHVSSRWGHKHVVRITDGIVEFPRN